MLFDSTNVKFKRRSLVIEIRKAVALGGLSEKEPQGIFWDDENVLYLDWKRGYRGDHTIVKNS